MQITKELKSKIVEKFENKEERMLISNVLDKVYRFEKVGKIEVTCFLNLYEYKLVSDILNYLKVDYTTYAPNENADKKVIFFLPDYVKNDESIYSNYISCLKIVAPKNTKLLHKDYMGSIYNLGIKNENIGDIFVLENECYVFLISQVTKFVLQNLSYVGRQSVSVEQISLDSDEIKNINLNIKLKEYILPSMRADTICSYVFGFSRMQTKEKIQKGDLFINDKVCYYASTFLKVGDIISFRRGGKALIKEEKGKTKKDNIVLVIGKFC